MARPSRTGIVQACLLVFGGALVLRAAYVQLWQGRKWTEVAHREHVAALPAMASRGTIVDAAGAPLVVSRELMTIGVAPRDVKDQKKLQQALTQAGVPAEWVTRALDRHRKWVEIPTRLLPEEAATIASIRGVRTELVADRMSFGMDGLVSGLEVTLDTVLRGDTSDFVVQRDALGRRFALPSNPVVRPASTVVLTINPELQDICERAINDAVTRMQASGGDIVVLDPRDGSVLALAGVRTGQANPAVTALTEPFEPGSTLKPFIGAALIEHRLVTPTDVVDTHRGSITIEGRTITDEHHAPSMTLRDVIRWSSNVGITQFAQRLSAHQEYEALRDVGFGMPTGLPYRGESGGTLRRPSEWSKQSPASLAMGYEIAVTPMQLAAAYAAIANGGELLEPTLVREIRAPDGTAWYTHQRRVVRRVMSPQTAAQIRDALVATVQSGTGMAADLSTFVLAGKTGTARRVEGRQGYRAHAYTASFVGLFPAQDPQYVVLVKIDDPAGSYFGGSTAAPVSKTILEAALAARDAALDRGQLMRRDVAAHSDTTEATPPSESAASTPRPAAVVPPALKDTASELVTTFSVPLKRGSSLSGSAVRSVPDVRGLSLRAAVRVLSRAGFRVLLTTGALDTTVPLAGSAARPGTIVRLGAGGTAQEGRGRGDSP